MLESLKQQGVRFCSAYLPLTKRIWFEKRGLLLWITFFSVVTAVAQTVLIAVLVGGLRLVNPDEELKLLGYEIWFREHPIVTLTGVAAIYIVVGVVAAMGAWKREVYARQMAREFQESDTAELLDRVSNGDVSPRRIPRNVLGNPNNGFIQGPLINSIAFETITDLIPPIVLAIAFSAALVVLDWRLVFLAIPFITLPFPALYFLNRLTHQASSRFYGDERKEATVEVCKLVTKANLNDNREADYSETYYQSELIRRANDDYDTFKLANQKSTYLNGFYRTIGIGIGLVGFGAAAVTGWFSWITILGSILALQRLQTAFAAGLSGVTSLMRFLTVVEGHSQLIDSFSGEVGCRASSSDAKIAKSNLVIADSQYGKIGVSGVLSAFDFNEGQHWVYVPKGASLSSIGEDAKSELSKMLGKEEKLCELIGDFDIPSSEDDWESTPRLTQDLLSVLNGLLNANGPATVIVEGYSKLLEALDLIQLVDGGLTGEASFLFFASVWKDDPPEVDMIWKIEKDQIVDSGDKAYWDVKGGLYHGDGKDGGVDLTSLVD